MYFCLFTLFLGKRCTAGFVLDESSSACVGVTNKLFGVGDQTSANAACQAFKNGVGSHVTGTSLCDGAYRGTIYVSINYTAIATQPMHFNSLTSNLMIFICVTKIECIGCE